MSAGDTDEKQKAPIKNEELSDSSETIKEFEFSFLRNTNLSDNQSAVVETPHQSPIDSEEDTMSEPKIAILTQENYESWKVQMKAILQDAKPNLWLDLDGKDASKEDYKLLAEKAFGKISLRCDPEHVLFISTIACDDSVKALNALKDRYEGKGVMPKIEILQKCFSLRLDSGTIDNHVNVLRMSYKRLAEKGLILPEVVQIANLMISLPADYGTIIASLLHVDEDALKFENVVSTLLAEQRRRKLSEVPAIAAASQKPDSSKRSSQVNRRNLYNCEFCKKRGHTIDRCFSNPANKERRKTKQTSNLSTCKEDDEHVNQSSMYSEVVHNAYAVPASKNSRNSNVFSRLSPKIHKSIKPKLKSVIIKIDNNSATRKRQRFESGRDSPKYVNASVTSLLPPSTPGRNLDDIDNLSLSDISEFEINCNMKEIEQLNKDIEMYNSSSHSANKCTSSSWIIDSGASIHMSYNDHLFNHLTRRRFGVVKVANGECIPICGYGTTTISINTQAELKSLELKNVAYVPDLHMNLISVNELNKCGHTVTFKEGICSITSNNECFPIARFINNNFLLNERTEGTASHCVHDWHVRFAHRNLKDILRLKEFGLPITKCKCLDQCDACMKGKMTALPFSRSIKPRNVLDIIVSDICGPIRTQSLGGSRYFLTITDVRSDYTQVKFLRQKSEAPAHIMDFIEFSKTQLSRKPKIFRSDGGGEFTNNELKSYFKKEGIRFETTVPYTPQQNGIAERKNRTLNDSVRTILIAAQFPDNLWAEAMQYVIYTQNRIIRKDEKLTPIELFFNKKSIGTFWEFGSPVYVTTARHNRGKLDPHGSIMRFLSVDDKSKGFRLWDGSKILIERNVRPKLERHQLQSEMNQPAAVPDTILNDCSDPEVDEQLPRRSKRLIEKSSAQPANLVEADPKTYKQALKSNDKDEWLSAMNEEMDSLRHTGTFILTDLPKDRKTIGCKWVFKKKSENNSVRFKARLVAKGFSQKYGEDYDEIFAPVARAPTIRLLLSMAGKLKLHIKQFDVKTAFLNGHLDEEIYMEQPEGFQTGKQVLRLQKSLYGLKQAARSWNIMLKNCLQKVGFTPSEADDCFFIKKDKTSVCYIVVHVDDMLFAATNINMIDRISNQLSKFFVLKDLGPVKQFLGVDIHSSNGFFGINQASYIMRMAAELQLDQSKAQKYPMQPGYFRIASEDFLPAENNYRKVIGMLLYVSTNSRPDISLSVCVLAQRVEKPRVLDLQEALRVVKYLVNTKDHILHLNNPEIHQQLIAFSDANHGECRIDGKSNSGIICFVNGGPIIWSSRKQSLVALSTCEAEYYAITEAAKEVIWLRQLLKSFDISEEIPTTILTDNQSSISMINNGEFMQRTKYIGVRYHFIRDWIDKSVIKLNYCPSEYNIADMLTKPLGGPKIVNLRTSAGLLNPHLKPSKDTNSILSKTTSAIKWI